MGWLENLVCKRVQADASLCHTNYSTLSNASREKDIKILTLDRQLSAATAALNQTQLELMSQINSLITDNEKKTHDIELLKMSQKSVFDKPLPMLLQEVPGPNVMLGNFIVTTARGNVIVEYPVRPAVFQPCPIFEKILDRAGCNVRRDDITSVEICTRISNVFQNSMHYVTDEIQWGRSDNWTPAILPFFLNGDDCKSEAHTIASACIYYEWKFGAFQDISVMTGYGHMNDYGHGFVLLMSNVTDSFDFSYIIEATLQYAASPKTLNEARNDYKVDWGVIGFVRRDHPEGTYWFLPQYSWWGQSAVRVTDLMIQEFMEKVKRRLSSVVNGRSPKQIKHDIIHEIWQNKRR